MNVSVDQGNVVSEYCAEPRGANRQGRVCPIPDPTANAKNFSKKILTARVLRAFFDGHMKRTIVAQRYFHSRENRPTDKKYSLFGHFFFQEIPSGFPVGRT